MLASDSCWAQECGVRAVGGSLHREDTMYSVCGQSQWHARVCYDPRRHAGSYKSLHVTAVWELHR